MTKYPIKSSEEIVPVVGLLSDEQEFTITASRNDKKITIYVSDNTFLTKVKRAFAANPTGWTGYMVKNKEGNPTGYFFETSKKYLTLRTKDRTKELTEEQKAAVAERLKKSRKPSKKTVT